MTITIAHYGSSRRFIKKSVQKELNSFSANKRKADESNDDESVKSAHMAEGQELAAFNYGLGRSQDRIGRRKGN